MLPGTVGKNYPITGMWIMQDLVWTGKLTCIIFQEVINIVMTFFSIIFLILFSGFISHLSRRNVQTSSCYFRCNWSCQLLQENDHNCSSRTIQHYKTHATSMNLPVSCTISVGISPMYNFWRTFPCASPVHMKELLGKKEVACHHRLTSRVVALWMFH